jgi:hypothetical protein
MKHIFKSWKTSLCGIATILAGVKTILTTGDLTSAVNTLLIGFGLLFAKDLDVSGQ